MKRLSIMSWNVLFLFLICVQSIGAQELKVKNVQFEDLTDKVKITYDLEGQEGKKYNVSAALSFDRGNTFPVTLTHLSGDVGGGVRPGTNKTILWDLKEQYPFGIRGNNFVFSVTAQLQKGWLHKWPYYTVAAGVAGSIIYFVSKGSKPVNTNLSITIPAEF